MVDATLPSAHEGLKDQQPTAQARRLTPPSPAPLLDGQPVLDGTSTSHHVQATTSSGGRGSPLRRGHPFHPAPPAGGFYPTTG